MKYYKKDKNILMLHDGEKAPSGYAEITETEYNRIDGILLEISELKFQLGKTDYEAIKHSEGWISDEDYASIKAARQELRVQINALEDEI